MQNFEKARDTFGKTSTEWQCLESWRIRAENHLTEDKSVQTIHPYAAELAKKISNRTNHRVSIKFRTLLGGFGYYRRTEAIISTMYQHLNACGLDSDFSVNTPKNLDERITLTVIEPLLTKLKQEQQELISIGDGFGPIANTIDATVMVNHMLK